MLFCSVAVFVGKRREPLRAGGSIRCEFGGNNWKTGSPAILIELVLDLFFALTILQNLVYLGDKNSKESAKGLLSQQQEDTMLICRYRDGQGQKTREEKTENPASCVFHILTYIPRFFTILANRKSATIAKRCILPMVHNGVAAMGRSL